MKKKLQIIGLLLAMVAIAFSGCKSPTLEPGGAYNPATTNADGTLTPTGTPMTTMFVADAAYRLAYDAVDQVLLFELNNRAQLQAVSPQIKIALDSLRPKVADIDHRWAITRAAYLASPTAVNLTAFNGVVGEMKALVPQAQAQMVVAPQP